MDVPNHFPGKQWWKVFPRKVMFAIITVIWSYFISGAQSSAIEIDDNLCLIRATDGKKKISTVVHAKDVTRFQLVRYEMF